MYATLFQSGDSVAEFRMIDSRSTRKTQLLVCVELLSLEEHGEEEEAAVLFELCNV